MSDFLSKLDNKKFQNWLKAFLALNITKEGIENFVSRRISDCHSEILDKILSKEQRERNEFCKSCDVDKFLPSATKQYQYCQVCDPFRDNIRRKHVNNYPSWKNTQPAYWCTNPWEMAKCYMPPTEGYKKADSAQQTDFNGIISIILNHTDLSKYVDTDICKEVRQISNNIRHAPNLLLEDADLDNFVDKLVELLICTEKLKADPVAVVAHQDLLQLKANTLVVSIQHFTKVVHIVSKDNKENIIVHLHDIEDYLNITDIKAGKDFGALCSAVKLLAARNIQLEQNLKTDLIDFYKEEYGYITLSPIVAENDVKIIDFYVKPKLEKKAWGALRRTPPTSVKTYEDIFGKEMKSYNNVYLCGQAGTGKTTFVKHLCTVWCCAKSENEKKPVGVSDEDFDTMKQVDFLFLILLRDARDSDTDEMITKQVKNKLSRGSQYDNEIIQHILHNHRCVVIMDGLDEWSPQDPEKALLIPDKKVRKKCTYLSTTRPWKMHDIKIQQSKVNNYIEITFLDETSVKALITNVIYRIADNNDHPLIACGLADDNEHPLIANGITEDKKHQLTADGKKEDMEHLLTARGGKDGKEHQLTADGKKDDKEHQLTADGTKNGKEHQLTADGTKHDMEHRLTESGRKDDKEHNLTADGKRDDKKHTLTAGGTKDDREQHMTSGGKIYDKEHKLTADDFLRVIKDLHLEDLMYTPVILIQLVLLWHDKRDLGQSRCEIYSNIIDYILEVSEQKHKDLRSEQFACDCSSTFPDCFKDTKFSKRYYKLLLALGKLAYETLFKKRKESSVVFDDETLCNSITDESMRECCFNIGLLTKSQDSQVLSKRVFKYSFMHKTIQEFLCALYIKSLDGFTVDVAKEVCSTLVEILDMAHVFVFLGGLCTKTAAKLSDMGAKILENDSITLDFRSRVSTSIEWHERFKCLKEYQDMFIESVQEGQCQIKDTGDSFAMEDFFVDDQCRKTSYRNAFESLLDMNRKTIKTITIYDCGIEENIHSYIKELKLGDVRSLKKVEVIGHLEAKYMNGLLDGSAETLECLSLCVERRRYKESENEYVALSEFCIKKITTMKNLQALMLEFYKVTHNSLQDLLQFLTKRKDMRQINLAFIVCSDHGNNCTGFDLDLSLHTDLDMLELGNVPVSHLKLCVKALKQCRIGSFTDVNVLDTILYALSNAHKKQDIPTIQESLTIGKDADAEVEVQAFHTIKKENIEENKEVFIASCKSESVSHEYEDSSLKEEKHHGDQRDKTTEEIRLASVPLTECNSHLLSFMCFDSPSTSETGKILNILPSLNGLKTLILKKIEVLEEHVKAPPHVDHIKLEEVSMTAEAFNMFLMEVNKNDESVRLEIVDCKIIPEEKYQACREEVQSSERYVVHYEGSSERFGNQFIFTKLNKSSIHRISGI